VLVDLRAADLELVGAGDLAGLGDVVQREDRDVAGGRRPGEVIAVDAVLGAGVAAERAFPDRVAGGGDPGQGDRQAERGGDDASRPATTQPDRADVASDRRPVLTGLRSRCSAPGVPWENWGLVVEVVAGELRRMGVVPPASPRLSPSWGWYTALASVGRRRRGTRVHGKHRPSAEGCSEPRWFDAASMARRCRVPPAGAGSGRRTPTPIISYEI
jgi:hypothetical protein